ncbi:MAG TPA: FAD:protein FMN transferase, partial [Candidatus Saccharimonadales bacterium]|nr:FAD:protein FMN transferase [Candidatus Saccharimonadales bacterium]
MTKAFTERFEAIGTVWNIHIHETLENEARRQLMRKIRRRTDDFDKHYSRFRDDSWVTKLALRTGRYAMPPDCYPMMRFYEELYEATAGKVTPLIGRLMADAGYDAEYSFRSKELRRPPVWKDVLSYDKKSLQLTEPVVLDFGAAGKGYLVDIIGEMLEEAGIGSYLIDAGGDIRHRSTRGSSADIGLENPSDPSEAIGIVRLGNRSLCASAGSRRQWGAFHHIIDPVKLQSPRNILASWVIAEDTMTADGLATALFFAEPTGLQQWFSFSYAILYESMALL